MSLGCFYRLCAKGLSSNGIVGWEGCKYREKGQKETWMRDRSNFMQGEGGGGSGGLSALFKKKKKKRKNKTK